MLENLSHRNMKRQLSEYKIFWVSLVGVVALMYAFNSLIVSRLCMRLILLLFLALCSSFFAYLLRVETVTLA